MIKMSYYNAIGIYFLDHPVNVQVFLIFILRSSAAVRRQVDVGSVSYLTTT